MLGGHRPRLPPPRPVRRHRGRRLPAVGARRPGLPGHPRRRPSRASTCSTRPSSCPRSSRRCRPIGLLTLTGNPTNFFAETEQVAFHVGNLVPGIDVTERPAAAGAAVLLPRHPAHPPGRARTSTRSRSTGRTRRSTTCCATASTRTPCTAGSRRTGRTRSTAAAPSTPAAPTTAPSSTCRPGWPRRPRPATSPASFDDHFSQARLFWLSMTPVEQEHIVLAYTFELAQVLRAGDQGAPAAGAGQHRPRAVRARWPPASACPAPEPTEPLVDVDAEPGAVAGRRAPGRPTAAMVGIVVDPDGDLDGRRASWRGGRRAAGMVPLVVAPHGGTLPNGLAGAAHLRAPAGRSSSTRCSSPGARRPAPTRCRRATARPARRRRPALDPRVVAAARRSASGTPRRSAPGAPARRRSRTPGSSPARPASSPATSRARSFAELHALMGAHRVWERFSHHAGLSTRAETGARRGRTGRYDRPVRLCRSSARTSRHQQGSTRVRPPDRPRPRRRA